MKYKARTDGSTCQKAFVHSVSFLGVESRVERILDAKAAGTTRVGKRPADYIYIWRNRGAFIECKETSGDEFKFQSISNFQWASAERSYVGKQHYFFVIFHLMDKAMYVVPYIFFKLYKNSIYRSKCLFIDLDEHFRVPRLPDRFELNLLVEMVSMEVDDLELACREIVSQIG